MLHAAGVALGWLAYCSKTYRRKLRRNLALAGYEDDRRLRRAAIGEAGKMAVEVPKILLGPRAQTLALVREFNGREHIEQARAAGKGIVYLTPHFGCFELAGQVLNEIGPLTALYRPPKMAWLGALLEKRRSRADGHLAPADLTGVRALIAALRRGESIIMLPDQVPGRGEGVWTEFFGKSAYTMTLAARLAERKDSACMIVTCERLPRGRDLCCTCGRAGALRVNPRRAASTVRSKTRSAPARAVPLGLQPLGGRPAPTTGPDGTAP
jgi:KDO2-lipid IV(A) lauroyltransferase